MFFKRNNHLNIHGLLKLDPFKKILMINQVHSLLSYLIKK